MRKSKKQLTKKDKERLAAEAKRWDNRKRVPKGWIPAPHRVPSAMGKCYYCGEKTEPLAGNPGRWPVLLPHSDDPGVMQTHHMECVLVRLDAFDRLTNDPGQILLKIVNGALRSCIDAHGDITPEWIGSAGKRIESMIRGFLKNEFKLNGNGDE